MKSPPARRRKELGTPCPSCTPETREECRTCHGNGWTPEDPRAILEAGEPPAFLVATHEVLSARSAIAKYGVEGWMRLADAEPSDCLLEAMDVIDGEIARLEHEAEAAKVRTDKKGQGRR